MKDTRASPAALRICSHARISRPFGRAAETIQFGGAGCNGGCDLRSIHLPGGTLILAERSFDGTGPALQDCPVARPKVACSSPSSPPWATTSSAGPARSTEQQEPQRDGTGKRACQRRSHRQPGRRCCSNRPLPQHFASLNFTRTEPCLQEVLDGSH
jgi:hypothetical protein